LTTGGTIAHPTTFGRFTVSAVRKEAAEVVGCVSSSTDDLGNGICCRFPSFKLVNSLFHHFLALNLKLILSYHSLAFH